MKQLERLVNLVRRLGEMALTEQPRATQRLKADGTSVTEMDKELESRLRSFLHCDFADCRVLGEEGGFTGPEGAGRTWVIDPIDGTTNYGLGLPFWAISVGLLEGGTPVWGCVYIPPLQQFFLAERGKGAFRNGEPIAPLRRSALEREDLFGITSDGIKRWDYLLPQKIRSLGSAASQAVFVACGHYVGYFLDDWHIWDIAAALLIAKEAGAEVTDYQGNDFEHFAEIGIEKGPPILFCAPGLNDRILPLILPKHPRS
ncbi:MAG: inositol monophosphatase family protein [Thermodesulfobacteriota bacterium]